MPLLQVMHKDIKLTTATAPEHTTLDRVETWISLFPSVEVMK